MPERLVSGISSSFPELSQSRGQVTHVLLTRSPLSAGASSDFSFDLHVLSTPPAFVLSQDQTLRKGLFGIRPKAANRLFEVVPKDRLISSIEQMSLTFDLYQRNPASLLPNRSWGWRRRGFWHRLCGTLLSSQGSDAHRLRISRSDSGQPYNVSLPAPLVKPSCERSAEYASPPYYPAWAPLAPPGLRLMEPP